MRWVGRLFVGVVEDTCALFSPFEQEGQVFIKVYKQYSTASTPQFFCVNQQVSVLAVLSSNFVEFFHIDTDATPYAVISLSSVGFVSSLAAS